MTHIRDNRAFARPRAEVKAENRSKHHEADAVIIGAGILGCAMAVALGNQGRSVILLETKLWEPEDQSHSGASSQRRLREPDRIVGELLQPGGVQALEKLGLRDCLEDIDAIKVHGYTVFYYGEGVKIPYPENAGFVEEVSAEKSRTDEMRGMKRKRPEGRSFHHGRFVRRLREKALANSNVMLVEATATDLVRSGYTGQVLGVEATVDGALSCFFGDLTIAADGYASKFRKQFRTDTPIARSKFWGLELIDAKLPHHGHGHVILGDGAPVLMYQIGTHETRALIDIPENLPSASAQAGGVRGHLKNVVLPSLPEVLKPPFEAALERNQLRSMPNSWLPPTTNKQPGLILLGDAMNMRHPLTGGGMTVALTDVVLLSELLSPHNVPSLDDTSAVLHQMRAFHWQRKGLSSVINILAQALYSLFAANDAQLKVLQRGCFEYFKLGGNCIDGPVGLLGAIIRQPLVLVYHFFAVALYAMWLYIIRGNILMLPFRVIASFAVFWKACVVIFPYIFSELKT